MANDARYRNARRQNKGAKKMKDKIEAMRAQLKSGGAQVVSAPQLFPTPPELVARMIEIADIQEGEKVLEPSAGTGAILDQLTCGDITAVEIDYELCRYLRNRTFDPPIMLIEKDFLDLRGGIGTLDKVIMNPPFAKYQDVSHITHALKFLRPGGRLVAIASGGITSRQNNKSKVFRELLESLGAEIEPLPEGTFKDSGTMVNTVLITVDV